MLFPLPDGVLPFSLAASKTCSTQKGGVNRAIRFLSSISNVIPPSQQKLQLLSKKPSSVMVLSVGLPCQDRMGN